MLHSTHYNLNLAEGTDLVNPLTVDVPNYQTIDSALFANEQAGVGTATELKSGTIHAITRTNTNTNVFRFRATSVFNVGDSFTVDGGSVTALYPDGSTLKERCFIVGSEVLCMLTSGQLTVITTYYPDASDVHFDDTDVSYTATNVQDAIEEVSNAGGVQYGVGVSVKDMLDAKGITGASFSNIVTNDSAFNCYTVGKVCILNIQTLKFVSNPTDTSEIITGLPSSIATITVSLTEYNSKNNVRLRISGNKLQNLYDSLTTSGNYYGTIVYTTL